MRYAEMRGHLADVTKAGKLRKRAAQALSTVNQPPPTPARIPTGQRGDHQGNVYAMHYRTGNCDNVRELRRANRFGRFTEKPMRSRIQRTTRKRRTGGVK